jgi:hypothetical protein
MNYLKEKNSIKFCVLNKEDKMTVIKDDYGKDYKVSDLQAFKNHIEKYHSYNGKGDGSLHEENGYWFRVTEDFYNYIMSL